MKSTIFENTLALVGVVLVLVAVAAAANTALAGNMGTLEINHSVEN